MPALGIVLPSAGIKDLPTSHKSGRKTSSQRVGFSVLFGGEIGILLLKDWPSISAPRRTGALSPRAVADSKETPVPDPLFSYLDTIAVDLAKEKSRAFRRVVYDDQKWKKHRSSARHARHIFTIFSSRIVMGLRPPVFALTTWAVLVTLYNEGLELGYISSVLPVARVPILPFQLVAPALALLLVFRTNTSYSRFDEARKLWGSNVNRTRDFARQALTWIERPEDGPLLEELLRYTIAYPYTLKAHLVQGQDLATELEGVLLEKEQARALASSHIPNHVVQMMSACLANVQMSDFRRATMDGNMTQFHDNTGACERIFKTPIPVSYTRLVSRLLVLWHFMLPLGVWDECKILTPLAILTSAGALFCIDEVGVTIEEPFSVLALPAICDGIRSSIQSLVKSHANWAELNPTVKELADAPPAPPPSDSRPVPGETLAPSLAPSTDSPPVPLETTALSLAPPTDSLPVPLETTPLSLAPPTNSPPVPLETTALSLAPPTASPQVPVETPALYLAPRSYFPPVPVETPDLSLAPAPHSRGPVGPVEWTIVVANLAWYSLLLGVLSVVKFLYSGTQPLTTALPEPTSSDSEPSPKAEPAQPPVSTVETPLVRGISETSDIYY